ncbi:twin-arginine translocase TatA/TatE family subunit [Schlesneria paludicola]|uniref:twin-arginine translocase TatA/TatE family subunit n=1 Tax=Schlesneria paludicola TaxID=360056 RepID=UPI00029A612E|nr:twin-arginine translocase TatA/TatE family subunit [Schlesneria paludicola]
MLPGVGIPEMMFFGIIALLLFGKKLPEVARSLGKGVIEFKKGLRSIEDELDTNHYSPRHDYNNSSSSSNARPAPKDESVETSAPKFEPPTTEPHDAA